MQFKKILVPVDGSGTADNALRYGVEMAKTYGAQLFVTVVADIGEAAYPLMQVNLDRNGFASVREKAEAVMERIKKQIPQGLPFTPHHPHRRPWQRHHLPGGRRKYRPHYYGKQRQRLPFLLHHGQRQPVRDPSCESTGADY